MVNFQQIFTRDNLLSYSMVVIGAFIMAAGFVLFINPYHIVPGGVYGIGIVVHYLTKGWFDVWPDGIPVGLVGLSLDIPLIIIGMRLLGAHFGAKTVVGSLLMSNFMMILTWFIGENDPLGLSNDVLLSCIFGGVTVGLGLGIIFRARATSGGSDIVAMIIAKYTRLPVGQLLIVVDSIIVLVGLVTFGDWRIPLYSWIVIFITGRVIDVIVEGLSYEKSVFIISNYPELIRDKIIHDLHRGGTYIEGTGMYQGQPRKVIHTVMSRRELSLLKDYIRQVDPGAFVTVTDASEILGEGFKSLSEKVTG
ncbi:MAG: YitT family protein [Bacteroidales bacterium]